MKKTKRETVLVLDAEAWRYDEERYIPYPRILPEEVLLFHPRYIITQKPRNMFGMKDDRYIPFKTPPSVPGNKFLVGYYAITVKEFKEVLASLPHFPNKKEGKALRVAEAKAKR